MYPDIDIKLLKEFEEGLDTRYPEKSKIPAKIIGYGEISTVFVIGASPLNQYAFKRLPIFSNEEELNNYESILFEYIDLIKNKIGIDVVDTKGLKIVTSDNRFVYYIAQPVLRADRICNNLLHKLPDDKIFDLFHLVLRNLKRVWDFNSKNPRIKIGLDGQISNWAIKDDNMQELQYIDISTPLYRKNGKEMLNADLFLRSTPPVLRSIVKALFLQEILDRYYDFRLVVVDIVANFYKEGRPDLIEKLIYNASTFFKNECPGVNQITVQEVQKYYKNDAFIWSLFLSLRKLHRAIASGLLRQRYEFILPEEIKR